MPDKQEIVQSFGTVSNVQDMQDIVYKAEERLYELQQVENSLRSTKYVDQVFQWLDNAIGIQRV